MKFKKDAETITTDDPFYDMFDGGYIKPEDVLEDQDAQKVNDAIKTIQEFLDEGQKAGIIEYC